MRRNTWPLAAAAALVAVTVIGGVLVMSGVRQQALAAQQVPTNTAQVEKRTLSAMVSQGGILTYRARSDGSPYSVINQAQGTYTQLPGLGRVISQGHVLYRVNDRPGGVAAWLHAGLPDPVGRGERPGRRRAQRGSGRARLRRPGSAASEVGVLRGGDDHGRAEAPGRAGRGPERQPGSWSGGVRTNRPASDKRVSSARGTQPARRDGDAGHLDRAAGADLVGRLATDRGGSREQGDDHPTQQPDHPRCRLLGGDGRHLPVELRAGGPNSSSSAAAPGTDSCSSGGAGSSTTPAITVDVTFSDPAATGRWDQAPVQVGITTASVPGRSDRTGGRAVGPVRRGIRG